MLKLIYVLSISVCFLHSKAQQAINYGVMEKLEGKWLANGSAFGMPAVVTMQWQKELDGKFMQLFYQMVMTTKEGSQQIFKGTAYYKVTGVDSFSATWFDSGGEMHPVTATATGAELISIWGVQGSKLGKTTYKFIDTDTVEVTDFVQNKEGVWKQFNKNILKRDR